MGYPRDIDDYSDDELLDELRRREDMRARGLCDYCKSEVTAAPCRHRDRHGALLSVTIRFDCLPSAPYDPSELARFGEGLGLAASGAASLPPPRVWIRAGCAAGMILRLHQHGKMSADCLVAMIAESTDPSQDDATAERSSIISGYRSVVEGE